MEERKYYPLSDEQEGLVLLASVFPAPNILYLLTRIDFISEIDEERLLQAIRITDERLPYCRVQLHQQDEETVVQYLREGEPDPVSIYNLQDSGEEELEKLENHLEDDDGFVSIDAMGIALREIVEAASELKNS